MKGVRITQEQEYEAVRLYTTQLENKKWIGSVKVGRMLGISDSAVIKILHKHGIKTRVHPVWKNHKRGTKPIKNLPIGKPPLCKCGCNKPVLWNRRKNKWNVYIEGHYRPKQAYHSRDWLMREYVDNHRSVNDIAAEFGVNHSSVTKSLRKYRIPLRKGGETLALSGKMKGSLNPAWKGGIARDYHKAWKKISREIRIRDSNTCQICNRTKAMIGNQRPLHVHHIDYDKANNEYTNLITLCNECHRNIPEGDKEWQDKLAKLVNN